MEEIKNTRTLKLADGTIINIDANSQHAYVQNDDVWVMTYTAEDGTDAVKSDGSIAYNLQYAKYELFKPAERKKEGPRVYKFQVHCSSNEVEEMQLNNPQNCFDYFGSPIIRNCLGYAVAVIDKNAKRSHLQPASLKDVSNAYVLKTTNKQGDKVEFISFSDSEAISLGDIEIEEVYNDFNGAVKVVKCAKLNKEVYVAERIVEDVIKPRVLFDKSILYDIKPIVDEYKLYKELKGLIDIINKAPVYSNIKDMPLFKQLQSEIFQNERGTSKYKISTIMERETYAKVWTEIERVINLCARCGNTDVYRPTIRLKKSCSNISKLDPSIFDSNSSFKAKITSEDVKVILLPKSKASYEYAVIEKQIEYEVCGSKIKRQVYGAVLFNGADLTNKKYNKPDIVAGNIDDLMYTLRDKGFTVNQKYFDIVSQKEFSTSARAK